MADHRAEQILKALRIKLDNLTTTGRSVYRGRVYNLDPAELPAITIYSETETELNRSTNSLTDRALLVIVEGYAQTIAENTDEVLNAIRKDVTIAIMADEKLGLSFVIQSVEMDSAYYLDGEGDKSTGVIRMEWAIHYRRSITDPSV